MFKFKQKNRAILHLSKSEASLVNLETEEKTSFSFSEDTLKNLEILDQGALKQRVRLLKDKSTVGEGNIVMVLSDDFLFSKSITGTHPEDLKRDTARFLDEIPFERDKIVYKNFNLGGQTLVIATNKAFFKVIIETFKEFNWNICSVVPETIFSVLGEDKTTRSFNVKEADKFLYENTSLIKKLDFAECDTSENGLSIAGQKVTAKKVVITMVLLLILISSGYFGYKYKNMLLDQIKQWQTSQVQETQESTPSETTDSPPSQVSGPPIEQQEEVEENTQELDLTNITIQVLNAAGTSGLAGTTKDDLVGLGFVDENISVGNEFITENTTVNYGNQVSEEQVAVVTKYLEQNFQNVSAELNEELEGLEIVIVLGTQ